MDISIKEIIYELHKAFSLLNKDFFGSQLIEPAITVQSKGNRKNVLGWCSTKKIWQDDKEISKYEINMVAEYLDRGYDAAMTTLLHEMIHLYHLQNGIKDVSRSGSYHNKFFKNKAEELGFEIEYDKKIGWSQCILTEPLKEKINSYNINKSVFSIYRYSPDVHIQKVIKKMQEEENTEEIENLIETTSKVKKKSGYIKYRCPGCNITIRATKEVNVKCVDCDEYFEIEE